MKSISAELIAHKLQAVRTLAQLVRIDCADGYQVALTDHDTAIVYDDGDGAVTYSPILSGLTSNIETDSTFSVDNGEISGAISSTPGEGFTAQDILAGRFDGAECRVMTVNYNDLTQGHEMTGPGLYFLGEFKIRGLKYTFELRSLAQVAKVDLTQKTSLTCRAVFGDARCGVDAVALLLPGTVTSVEPTLPRLQFTDTGRAEADGFFVPGSVVFTSGANTGASAEVKRYISKTIELTHPLPFDVQIGDGYSIRVDCDKKAATCRDAFTNLANFRGEPFLPVADGDSKTTPGGIIEPKESKSG